MYKNGKEAAEIISESLSYISEDILQETDSLRKKKFENQSEPAVKITAYKRMKRIAAAAATITVFLAIGGVAFRYLGGTSSKGSSKEMSTYNDLMFDNKGVSKDEVILESAAPEKGGDFALSAENSVAEGEQGNTIVKYAPTESPAGIGANSGDCAVSKNIPGISCTIQLDVGGTTGTLRICIDKAADYKITFGDMWKLEKYTGDTWTELEPAKKQIWNDSAYILDKNECFEQNIDLSAYGELPKGDGTKYRVTKHIYVNGTESYSSYVYFEFYLL